MCLELLIESRDNVQVMSRFVDRRGLTFVKGWLEEETTSVAMIRLLLNAAKVRKKFPVSFSDVSLSPSPFVTRRRFLALTLMKFIEPSTASSTMGDVFVHSISCVCGSFSHMR